MNTLYQLLKDFDGTKAKSIDELTQSFGVIAQRVLYGGHFLINDGTEIYPHEIEFYYEYRYNNPDETGVADNPRHLWEDMFGYHSINGEGLSIRWIDDPDFQPAEPKSSVRVNLTTIIDGQKVQDPKAWRFSK